MTDLDGNPSSNWSRVIFELCLGPEEHHGILGLINEDVLHEILAQVFSMLRLYQESFLVSLQVTLEFGTHDGC